MRRGFQPQRPGHPWVVRFVVVVLLATAFGGWWWLMQRTLANEREAVVVGAGKDRQQRLERALGTVSKGLDRDRDEVRERLSDGVNPGVVAALVEAGRVSAVLHPEPAFEAQPGRLPGTPVREPVAWGSDADGRDPVVSALLDRLDEPGVRALLRGRLLGRSGPPMKASFRHRAIERYLASGPDPLLEEIGRAERWRAEGTIPGDGVLSGADTGGPVLWWSPGNLAERFDEAGVKVRLGEEGRRFVSWSTPLRAELAPQAVDADFSGSAALVRWIGLGCGLLFAVVVLGALWSGWRDRKVARMRTDLAASVAHELRTPLAGQRVLLESLIDGLQQTPAQRREYLELALRSNRRLGSLAEQFLTFSRLERGVLRIERSRVPVREVVDEVLGGREKRFDRPVIEVPDSLEARVDRAALGSILGNLVENAWKYGGDEPWLRIGASRHDGTLTLEVEDRGRGLDAAQRRKVFRQFWRAETGLDRKVDGLGLGLTIVERLAEAHDGRVEVESEPGKGSLFRVILKEDGA